MSKCEPITLYNSILLNISQCKCCERIGLFYNNILVGFELSDFLAFCRGVERLDFERHAVPFPNGAFYVILDTCHEDIQFCFDKSQFFQLNLALGEAQLMIEVHQSLSSDRS